MRLGESSAEGLSPEEIEPSQILSCLEHFSFGAWAPTSQGGRIYQSHTRDPVVWLWPLLFTGESCLQIEHRQSDVLCSYSPSH